MVDPFYLKVFFGIAVGAAIGIAYSRLTRCSTGTCPLTSNWWAAGLYGGMIGLLLTSMSFAEQPRASEKDNKVRSTASAPASAPASQEGEKAMVKHVESEAQFDSEVLKSDKPVLVDFYATWCGPCRMITPIMEQLAGELEGKAEVYKLDVDKVGEIAARYRIMGVPTVMVFDDGKPVKTFVGVRSKADYKSAVEQAVASE